jgi:dsRNA-specific ribonuclease
MSDTGSNLAWCVLTRIDRCNMLNIHLWQKTQESLVSNDALTKRGLWLDLDAFIITNFIITGKMAPEKIADTFEAIAGAVCLDVGDNGLKIVYNVLANTGFIKDMMLSDTV